MKKAIRICIFLIGLFLLIRGISWAVTPRSSIKKLKTFFDAEQDFDVLFLGISHMEVGVHPLELWNEYGIASFDFGESGNTINSNYWVLQNALKYTSPKLVIIDTRHMDAEKDDPLERFFRVNYDAFPISLTKIRAALDLCPNREEALELIFPLISYHSRWSEVKMKDLKDRSFRIDKGSQRYGKTLTVAIPKIKKGGDSLEMQQGTAFATGYLRKTIELCRARGIEVMLTELPYPADKKSRELANGCAEIAAEYNVPFLNFLESDKIGTINFHTDMKDRTSHVNDSGARKVTAALGQFIKEHFDIPDRRSDRVYSSWNRDYEEYMAFKYNRINAMSSLDTALMLLSDKTVSSALYVRGDSPVLTDERMRGLILNIAQNQNALAQLPENASTDYFALIDNRGGTCMEAAGRGEVDGHAAGIDLSYTNDGESTFTIHAGDTDINPASMEGSDVCLLCFNEQGQLLHTLTFGIDTGASPLKGYRT